jgi:hypothetical protein
VGSAARRMALTRVRARLPPVTRRTFQGERSASGRRQPLLGPPGHGGVGAQVVPAARCTGAGAATVSARRASCKSGPSSRRSSVKPGRDHPQGRFASHVMAYGHPCG